MKAAIPADHHVSGVDTKISVGMLAEIWAGITWNRSVGTA
jgi:hypothetical protein